MTDEVMHLAKNPQGDPEWHSLCDKGNRVHELEDALEPRIPMKEISVCWKQILSITLVLTVGSMALPQEPTPANEKESASAKPDEKSVNWMQIKLRSSQEILAALTSGDTQKVEVNARRLLLTNLLEQWARKDEFKKKSEYEGELNRFEFSTKELIRFGRTGDIDGCLEAYQMLCRSCVECHKLIRDK